MFLRTTSIRGKIASGYAVGFLFLLLVASFLFVSLHVAEDEVESYFGISRFLDTTLEMRRYEKNYLLYGTQEDLEQAVRFAGSASALVSSAVEAPRHPRWLRLFANSGNGAMPPDWSPERTRSLLQEYAARLRAAGQAKAGGGGPEAAAAEAAVRDLGRTITGIAEQLSSAEGRNVQAMLRWGRGTLILLVAAFLVGTVFMTRMLHSAVRPLRELEAQMRRIASGDYHLLPEGPASDEIDSMNMAFNRMIREIFAHRQEMIQSERLAALGTMLAGIAHEINNPLSNVSTSAEILKEENERAGPQERRELIDQIITQTDRAGDIIRTVLDFSREPRGEKRFTNLLSAVRGSLLLVRGGMPAHVSVDVDVPPDLEVPAERTGLEQAFINLIANSIDAMRDPSRESRLSISARPKDGGAEIVFRDTGVGIPKHLADRVFDPFFTTKDVGRGTGLGLYLTHQTVEQHGGTIRVESEPGKGTAVVISLPGPGLAGEGSA